MTDNTVDAGDFIYGGYGKNNDIKWGNGNSLYYESVYDEEDDEYYSINAMLVKTTDENGYTDSTAPYQGYVVDLSGLECKVSPAYDIYDSAKVYANNGLVDIDTEYSTSNGIPYYATLESLGNVSSKATPFIAEDGILGEYYTLKSIEVRGTESIILKDEAGNKIATVEINNFKAKGSIQDNYYLSGQNDKYEDCVFTYDTNIQMAEGMDDWKVTVDFSNDIFNINAVKTVSTDDNNTSDNSYEVALPTDKTTISASDFASVLEKNKTKDVVIKSNNNITFTFAKGTMASVDGMENYDFGTSVVSDFANAGNMGSSVTKDNFVTRINYNYSGKLPAKANIKIYVGTDYAEGTTLYYSKIVEDGFKLIQSVKVDKDGYITVSQDSCSDYVVTTNKLSSNNSEDTTTPENDKTDETPSAPKTGDNSNIFTYVTMLVCGVGALVVAMQKKKLSR